MILAGMVAPPVHNVWTDKTRNIRGKQALEAVAGYSIAFEPAPGMLDGSAMFRHQLPLPTVFWRGKA
jgi:hypothetical protein